MEPVLAEIRMFGGNFAPRAWALCQGQLLAINSNQALFSLLGTTFGGDGRTTFGLPDMRGRAALGDGHGPGLSDRKLGAKGGTETNTINATQLASHTHTAAVKCNNASATGADPSNSYPAITSGRSSSGTAVQISAYGSSKNTTMATNGVVIGNTGGNQSVNNLQPYLVVNYIIALQGIFPSRN